MSALRRRLLAVVVVLAVGSGAFIGGHAIAAGSGSPANKMVAAGSKRVVVAPGTNEVIMSGVMHTSKPTDVMFHVSLECTIFTQLVTRNDSESATASGHISVWVEVDDKIVALQQISAPPQTPPTTGGDETDKVTFCDRTYHRTVTDGEDPTDGIDTTDDYINTKSAHGFNWVRMNMGSGDHKIEVVANLSTETEGDATAKAEIGNRSLIAEPAKMANDAIINETGTNP